MTRQHASGKSSKSRRRAEFRCRSRCSELLLAGTETFGAATAPLYGGRLSSRKMTLSPGVIPYRMYLDLIFANPDGTPLRPNSISSVVSLLFRRLGLPKGASLHSLRHTHGSHLVADGVPLPVVAERLGHSSVRTTADVYTHALRGQDDDAARRWDEFQRRGTDCSARKLQ
jgi:integrase